MGGRHPDKFVLKRKDAACLRQLLHDDQTPLKVARRAEILLGRSQGKQPLAQLGEKVEQHRITLWRVCARYRAGGLEAALYDASRSGHPCVFSPERTPED